MSAKYHKVVFGRELPQKKWRNAFSDIYFKIQFFFVKWRNVQFCMKIDFITKFFIYCPWFSRNNSISGATSLKALRKESLAINCYLTNLKISYSCLDRFTHFWVISPRFWEPLMY